MRWVSDIVRRILVCLSLTAKYFKFKNQLQNAKTYKFISKLPFFGFLFKATIRRIPYTCLRSKTLTFKRLIVKVFSWTCCHGVLQSSSARSSLLLLGFMANCNHVLSGAYRHLLYRSMQHGLAYSSMILLNKKINKYRDKIIIIIIISSFSLFPFLLPFPFSLPFFLLLSSIFSTSTSI